ncbi:Gfo/Idh/MocA family protein [Nonomuraea insulae]|uniref:Gfo/Idh/MocA family protein n=1 Tax=Nonomuraea insulae TaxID=1616787 RepID=A0ABW1CEC8_9ACTN
MKGRLGVGIVGAGPVTQAIHLPTLATLSDRFTVEHVMDVDEHLAATVAARAGARSSADLRRLLDDPAVDVIAICSPHHLHAQQVEAAVEAGKRAILCEKPLATTAPEVERIAEISRSHGVPVLVGAMHAYDPAYLAVQAHWGDLPGDARLIHSTIYLPSNDEFIALATDPATPPPPPPPHTTPAQRLRGGVLGLGTHVIPQLRRFMPEVGEVTFARRLEPFGYQILLTHDDRTAELVALMPGAWRPDWSFRVWGAEAELHITYPPSYVLAASATATLTRRGERRTWHFPHNGYQAEWAHLSDVALGKAAPVIPVQTAAEDMLFALDLADKATAAPRTPMLEDV